MRELILDWRAENELIDALVLHSRKWSGNGRDLHKEFLEAFEDIRANPKRFSPYKRGFRFCIPKDLPYVIYFLELPSAVWIVSISHNRRRPNYWMRRKPPRL